MKKILYTLVVLAICMMSCKPYTNIKKSVESAEKDSIQVVMLDKKVYTGFGKLPSLSSPSVKLIIENDQEIELRSDKIDCIYAWNAECANKEQHKFIYTPIKEYSSLDNNNNKKTIKDRPRWLLRISVVDNLAMYVEHQTYDLKKEGDISGNTTGVASLPPNIWYYIRRDGQGLPTRIGLDPSAGAVANKYFKSAGQKYFSSCPSVVEKIQKGDFETKTLEEAMAAFNECK